MGMKKATTLILSFTLMILNPLASAQANEICPLLETGEYGDLLQSVNNLDTQLKQLSPCTQNSSDPTSSLTAQEELRKSTQALQHAWMAPTGQVDPTAFASSITTAMNSLNTIGTNLKNAVSSRPECAAAIGKNPSVLLKLNEVAASLAPMFVLATVMVPTLKAAVPFAIGVAGVTTVISIMSNLRSQKLLNVADPDQARIVLQSLCQFKTVKKNVDYFLMIQAGRSSVVQSLEQLSSDIQKATLSLPPRVQEDIALLTQFKEKMNQELVQLQKPQKLLAIYNQSTLGSEHDDVYTCNYVLNEAQKNNFLSLVPVESLRRYMSESKDDVQISNLNSELEARLTSSQQLMDSMAISLKERKFSDCAKMARSWIQNAQNLLATSRWILNAKANFYFQKVSNDPEFKKSSAEIAGRESERQLLEKILDYMNNSTQGGMSMARSELTDRLQAIEKILIGDPGNILSGIPYIKSWTGSSLAGEWLNRAKEQLLTVETQFRTAFEALDQESKDFFRRSYNLEGFKQTKEKKLYYLQPLEGYDQKNAQWKTNACKRLDEIWLLWLSSKDHSRSLQFTCSFIEPLINSHSDPEVIRICGASFQLDSSPRQEKSWIQEHQLYSQWPESSQQRSVIIQQKKQELGCPNPEKPAQL